MELGSVSPDAAVSSKSLLDAAGVGELAAASPAVVSFTLPLPTLLAGTNTGYFGRLSDEPEGCLRDAESPPVFYPGSIDLAFLPG